MQDVVKAPLPLTTAALVFALAHAGPADACAPCAAGDPTLSVMGTAPPTAGRLRLGTELRFRSEGSRLGRAGARSDQLSAVGLVSLAAHDRLALSLELPITVRRVGWVHGGSTVVAGFSEAAVRAKVVLWRDRAFSPRHHMAVTLGARPSWPWPLVDAHARPLPIDAQPGLGAFLGEAGAFYGYRHAPWSVVASARLFAPASSGHDDFLPGSGLSTSVTGQLQPRSWLAVRAGADTLHTTASLTGQGKVAAPAGHLLTSHAGIVWAPGWDLTFQLLVRVPLLDSRWPSTFEGSAVTTSVVWDV
jgi:hypothetical protein